MRTRTPKTISAYHHKADDSTQKPDPRPGNYYCSVIDRTANDGTGRTGLLLGPFKTHKEALDMLPEAQAKACELCDRAIWYAFGTVRMADDYTKPGVLNQYFDARN